MGTLIIDGNSVYEIDEECVRKKEKQRQEREERQIQKKEEKE